MEDGQPKSIKLKHNFDFDRFGLSLSFPHDRECIFGIRTRFDFNSEGRELLLDYWGVQDAAFAPAEMSRLINGVPAVGSAMLDSASHNSLAQFAFFRMGAVGVCLSSGFMMGIFDLELFDHLRKSNQTVVFNYGHHTLKPHDRFCFR